MGDDVFYCDKDWEVGKVVKYAKINPVGEDVYLKPDGTLEMDEDKIINIQRIFKHNYYKPSGKWVRAKKKSWPTQEPPAEINLK